MSESAVEYNYLGHRTEQDDARAARLSDEKVSTQHKKMLDESGGEGISWLLYSPYEVALDAEHQKRFGSGLKVSTEAVVGSAITSLPKGRILGAAVEKLTGKDLGVRQIIEPTPSNFRFNIAGSKKAAVGSGKKVESRNIVQVTQKPKTTSLKKTVPNLTHSRKSQTEKLQPQLKVKKLLEVNTKKEHNTTSLLPNEGRVGIHGSLKKISKTDRLGLDAHHGPNDAYMKGHGISKNKGVSIFLRRDLHREIHKKLRTQDKNLSPRDALAQNILRTREVYKEHNLYLPQLRSGLQEQIIKSKQVHPK